jgi:hypothetical protein
MSEFEMQLNHFNDEAAHIQKAEIELKSKAQFFNQKLMAFMKEHGLSDDFTLPGLALLAIRKSRTEIIT